MAGHKLACGRCRTGIPAALLAVDGEFGAILGGTAGAQGSAQFVVDNIIKAKKALSAAQFACAEGTLEQVELPNKPGALADLTAKLAKKGANIDAVYGTVPKGAKKSVLFFATSKQAEG